MGIDQLQWSVLDVNVDQLVDYLIILYIKVNRDAALRSSKIFHPKLLIMVVTLDSLL